MEQYALSFVPERRIWSLRELSDDIRAALDRGFTNIWVCGRDLRHETGPQRPLLLHAQGCRRADQMRLLEAFLLAAEVQAEGWRSGSGARPRRYLRAAQRVPVRRRSHRAAGPRRASTRLRAAQARSCSPTGFSRPRRKRPLPRFPSRIGIVSSPKGAVIRDFIEILVAPLSRPARAPFPGPRAGRRLDRGRYAAASNISAIRLGGDHRRRARRRLARRSLDLQRRSRRARHRRLPHPRRFGYRTRNRRHHRRLRGRPARPHAVSRRRDDRLYPAGTARSHRGCAPAGRRARFIFASRFWRAACTNRPSTARRLCCIAVSRDARSASTTRTSVCARPSAGTSPHGNACAATSRRTASLFRSASPSAPRSRAAQRSLVRAAATMRWQ